MKLQDITTRTFLVSSSFSLLTLYETIICLDGRRSGQTKHGGVIGQCNVKEGGVIGQCNVKEVRDWSKGCKQDGR